MQDHWDTKINEMYVHFNILDHKIFNTSRWSIIICFFRQKLMHDRDALSANATQIENK